MLLSLCKLVSCVEEQEEEMNTAVSGDISGGTPISWSGRHSYYTLIV